MRLFPKGYCANGIRRNRRSQLLNLFKCDLTYSDVYSETVTREVPGVDDEQSVTVLVGKEASISPPSFE